MSKVKNLTGPQIKRKREDHGLSQKALAEEIGLKSASYLSFIEGGYKPGNDVLQKITQRLNQPVPKDVAEKVAASRARAKLAAKKRAQKATS